MFMNDDKKLVRRVHESDFNDLSSRIPVEQGANMNDQDMLTCIVNFLK